MVPDGWTATTLGECATFRSGGTPSKQRPEFWGGSVPWVSAKDLKSHHIGDAIDHLTDEGALGAKMAEPDAVLMLVRGMTLMKDVPIGLVTKSVAFNQDIKALIALDHIRANYLAYLLVGKKRSMMGLVNTANHGTGRLDTELLKSLAVDLPPLPEQRKIAEILSTWDLAIEVSEALLATARTQKRALMQSLLTGKRRFPEFEGQEWKEASLKEIATPVTMRNEGIDLPVLTISSKTGFVRQDKKYARYMAGESVKRYYALSKGQFAYNKGNSKTYQFGCVLRMDNFERGLVPHVYVCFELNDGYDSDYFRALFLADFLRPQLSRLVNTGVRNNGLLNISPSAFWTVKLPVPSLEEQRAIANVVINAIEEEETHVAQIEKLRTEKKALMQQLLTGKRRVTV